MVDEESDSMLNDFVHSKISMNYLSRLIDEYKGKETVTKIEEKTVFYLKQFEETYTYIPMS